METFVIISWLIFEEDHLTVAYIFKKIVWLGRTVNWHGNQRFSSKRCLCKYALIMKPKVVTKT